MGFHDGSLKIALTSSVSVNFNRRTASNTSTSSKKSYTQFKNLHKCEINCVAVKWTIFCLSFTS